MCDPKVAENANRRVYFESYETKLGAEQFLLIIESRVSMIKLN